MRVVLRKDVPGVGRAGDIKDVPEGHANTFLFPRGLAAEASAGELLVVRSAFTRLGSKSLTMSQRMTNAETGVLCATQEAVEVFFDLRTRSAIPIPDDIRAKLDRVVINPSEKS